jgi:hypothetical protein
VSFLSSLFNLLFRVEILRRLQAIQARVLSISLHELVVAPLFQHASIGQVQDAVGHANG